jgi:HAD superfamily hydrolase (TIGR01509 family)
MIQAVVFDMDGVLVDSEPVWERVRRSFVADHGGHWAADLGVGIASRMVAELVIAAMAAAYQENLPLLPGAVDAVRALSARWPLAVASSSPRSLIVAVLATAGLRPAFAAVVSSEEVARGKPAPDVYLEAAARLGFPAAACAAVEDSSNGLRAAVAAGCQVIAIPRPEYPPAPDALAPARLVLRSLTDLTPDVVAGVAHS